MNCGKPLKQLTVLKTAQAYNILIRNFTNTTTCAESTSGIG